MVAPPGTGSSSSLQQTLQAVVQSVQWTYSLFWQLCPQQGILVWGDGYYNGAIKTRKTVQPVEVSTEEASLQRSQQLRELYESLSTGDANLPARRPCAALSPEDLTEAEWFYLMCISFSFPPGVGLPGKAFAKQRHIWLMRANEVDSKVFSRAILAKSAHIQTVLCIPLMDGVLELGNEEKVEEDIALIQHAKRFFMDNLDIHTKPALSEHSTSNPFPSADHPLFQQQAMMHHEMNMDIHASNNQEEDDVHDPNNDEEEEEEEEEEDDVDQNNDYDDVDDEGDEIEGSSRSELKGMRSYGVDVSISPNNLAAAAVEESNIPATEASELMQLEMSEDIRVDSISDCSNNLDIEQMPAVCRNYDGQSKTQRQDDLIYKNWNFLLEDLGTRVQDFSPEDAHYSETVSSILQHNLRRWADHSSFSSYLVHSQKSAFSKWSCAKGDNHHRLLDAVSSSPQRGASQWLLKSVLLNIRDLHCKYSCDGSSPKSRDGEGGSKFQKCVAAQEEISANHVLAERRRREKLNERFMILRSLVPFVTKMDKASILGDTIEYVKQLRRRIQDLEARNRQVESDWRMKASEVDKPSQSKMHQSLQRNNSSRSNNVVNYKAVLDSQRSRLGLLDKRNKLDGGTNNKSLNIEAQTTNVHVSMIETDALLELHCCYRDGLLLKTLQALHELGLEITSIQFSSSNAVFNAEIRSKVKEVNGKRASIVDVKKAIHQIILSDQ